MEHLWDEFSKSLAEPVPRRESLRRFGAIFAGAVLAPVGLGAAWAKPPTDPCKTYCSKCPKNQQSQCVNACQACNGNTSRLCGSCGNYACCGGDLACCGGTCVDPLQDFYNCGGCGLACDAPGPYEDGACVDGTCLYQCTQGAVRCNGACTDLNWDRNNCGACGNVCGGPNPSCYQGACSNCQPNCPAGWCGGDGCGGECSCPSGMYCEYNGWCYDPTGCPPGTALCDGRCADILSDASNCGACGNVCSGDYYVCSSGACVDPVCQFYGC
jgi:hypothetical protein